MKDTPPRKPPHAGGRSLGNGVGPIAFNRPIILHEKLSPAGEWFSANDFSRRFYHGFGGLQTMYHRLHLGLVAARTQYVFCNDVRQEDTRFPVGFWQKARCDDWERGDFSARVDGRDWTAFGLEFAEVDGMAIGLPKAADADEKTIPPLQAVVPDRDAEEQRVAAELDEAGIRIGEVRSDHIAKRWDRRVGEPAKVTSITGRMSGQGKGGRRPARS